MMIIFSFVVAVSAYCSAVGGSPVYTSSVYLQRGPDRSVPAVEYVEYGPSAVTLSGSQYARLAASPVVPYTSGYRPCVSPCVIEPVGAVAPIPTANAKIVTYQKPAPKVTIVPRSSEEPGTYEYSYIVYDEDTGDQKAQHELSEGGKVRGQYSFIQPDGYIREVKYTADDLSGFNAIVKNFLPKLEDTKAELKVAHLESHEEVEQHSGEHHSGEHHSGEHHSGEHHSDEHHSGEHHSGEHHSGEYHSGEHHSGEHHSEEHHSGEEVHGSAEVSTDAPDITGDTKIVVTFEDIIRCAQAAIVAGSEKKAEAAHGSHENSEGDGHGHGHSEKSHGSHEEHAGHDEHGHAEHSHEEAETPKAAKSALSYIILPSLGLKKPC